MKKTIKSVLFLFSAALLFFTSCEINKESEMVRVSFTTEATLNARSISPDAEDNTNVGFFNDTQTVYCLSGTSGDSSLSKEFYGLKDFNAAELSLKKGKWDFTLSVYYNNADLENNGKDNIFYSAETSIDLENDETISFDLQYCASANATGDIRFYFGVPSDYSGIISVDLYDSTGNKKTTETAEKWSDCPEGINGYNVSFNDVEIGTYTIKLDIKSSVTTTTWNEDDDGIWRSKDSTVEGNNFRRETGILVLPGLLTSNVKDPRDFTEINQYTALDYSTLLISGGEVDDYPGRMNVDNFILYYNKNISGNETLCTPSAAVEYPSYPSWEYAFKKWVAYDKSGNIVIDGLETKTSDDGTTSYILPRDKNITKLAAVYEKSNCSVTLNIGSATWDITETGWSSAESGVTATTAYNTTVTIPDSSDVVPKMTGWTFVGFSATETAMDKTKKSKDDFSDYISLGDSYTVTGDVTLYPLWYYNGKCDMSSSYTTPNGTVTEIKFDDDGNAELSDVASGTTIALSSTTTNATIKYLVSETELTSVSVSAITSEYTKETEIKPTVDCFIYAYVSDSKGVYENSDIYKITVTMNKADINLALSDFNFELITESGTDGNTKTFTIKDAQTDGSLDAYKGILTVRWYLNDIHKSVADNTFSLTINLDSDMDLQESNIVRAEISYNGLYQTVSGVFGLSRGEE